jgi:CheY-like chemotaxis protein
MSDDRVTQHQAEQVGCVAYLRKPFTANVLLESLARAIGHPA